MTEEERTTPNLCRIIVGNLLFSVKEEKLRDELTSKFGPLVSCRIPTKHNGRSKGMAIIEFEKLEDAAKFFTEMNGQVIFERKCYLTYADEVQQQGNNHNNDGTSRRPRPPMRNRNDRGDFDDNRNRYRRYPRRRDTDSSDDEYPSSSSRRGGSFHSERGGEDDRFDRGERDFSDRRRSGGYRDRDSGRDLYRQDNHRFRDKGFHRSSSEDSS